MRKALIAAIALGISLVAPLAQAQLSISPLTSFGGGDGWFAPGEGGYTFLGTVNNERGMAYGNDHLYLVSRSGGNFIRRLDALTGADLGSPLDVTGIAGGTFAVNKIAVAADGSVYVNNLTTQSSTSPFRVYRWGNDAALPSVAFSGDVIPGARIGDSTLGVSGSGASTILVTGFAAATNTSGLNGYGIINPTAGTATAVGFAGSPPAVGDFRLGLTIGPAGQVWGLVGSQTLRETSFSGSSGTLLGTGTGIFSVAERPMSFAVINGLSVLATISTGDSTVRVYDASNPLALILLGSGNATSGALTSNGNATGDVAWGTITDNGDGTSSARLYAMSSNQGIQAFTVVVPEPSTAALAGLAICALIAMRRLRK